MTVGDAPAPDLPNSEKPNVVRLTSAASPLPWWGLVLIGLLDIGAGILVLVYPDISLLVIALVLGVYLLVAGALAMVEALIVDAETVVRALQAVLGLIAVIAGLVVLRQPGDSLLAIVIVAGIFFVVQGVVALVRAYSNVEARGLSLLLGVVNAVVGIVILSWPELGLTTFAILIAIDLILQGLAALALGLMVRRM
ncbi:MAG TPA: DUF308 domain-containing protein [Baekduia sp.]|nr:DUF308 domain-containing protein [Baekduia sp.]